MISASETAAAAYFAGSEAVATWGALRSVASHVRPLGPISTGNVIRFRAKQQTQALPDARNAADTLKTMSAYLPVETVADTAVSQLLKFERFPADWDGYGAAKPVKSSMDAARAFIRSLAPESIVPQPALHADGNAILFYRANDVYAEFEFVGTTIEFFARRGDKEWSSEFQVGAPLPAALSEIGFSI
ncbi:hypothetical protein SAMN05216338_104954 [Bradyrhizobium sp. Rc2d]|uniref:hypothetical protein n=1 Tax=Bradyrhizobium sp. Rc2d TaxID=1855321 RepID=UPI000886093A|nr:hypothetical protein [Bradyrhizobium sp. Rc2d]SDJ43328.1 hypothetical protein SAMN05216338_104954 [Bradyrhizobium sp. Rc2d]